MYNTHINLWLCIFVVTLLAGKGFEVRRPCCGNRFLEGEVQGLIPVSISGEYV